jgi:hypothetical protein
MTLKSEYNICQFHKPKTILMIKIVNKQIIWFLNFCFTIHV